MASGPGHTPVSPPNLSTTATGSTSDSVAVPISPVVRSGTFEHKTSPAVATQTPLIDTATPAINDAPVELDGIPTSAEELKRRTTDGSAAGILSPADEEDIDGEFLGEGIDASKEARAKRAAMLASRSKDPSVIVDIPHDPTAEEVEAAKSAEGTVTPSLSTPGLPSGSFSNDR